MDRALIDLLISMTFLAAVYRSLRSGQKVAMPYSTMFACFYRFHSVFAPESEWSANRFLAGDVRKERASNLKSTNMLASFAVTCLY